MKRRRYEQKKQIAYGYKIDSSSSLVFFKKEKRRRLVSSLLTVYSYKDNKMIISLVAKYISILTRHVPEY
jgi:hypothetical protein